LEDVQRELGLSSTAEERALRDEFRGWYFSDFANARPLVPPKAMPQVTPQAAAASPSCSPDMLSGFRIEDLRAQLHVTSAAEEAAMLEEMQAWYYEPRTAVTTPSKRPVAAACDAAHTAALVQRPAMHLLEAAAVPRDHCSFAAGSGARACRAR
jgi:hypothetical protein